MLEEIGMQLALTLVCLMGCGALVYAEHQGHNRLRIAAKLIASLAFVMLGLEALEIRASPEAEFALAILAGLVLGAIGDAALLGRGKQWFTAGLVAFLLGHIAYVIAVSFFKSPETWLSLAGPVAALPVIVGGAALVRLWPTLGSMKIPVILYVLNIVTMVIAAIAVARGTTMSEPHRYLFLAGAVLFFVSDLAVARDRFIARTFANKAWGLPAYYTGQLLIAWSLIGLG